MAEDLTSERLAALEEQIRLLNSRLRIIELASLPDPPPLISEKPPVAPKLLPANIAIPPSLPAQPPSPPRPRIDLEATIGKNLASWIGAILLLLGVCFFLKYAWDHQWIHPTPMMRMITGIVTGLIVAGLGMWTFHRRMRPLAGACFGATIAIIMASFIAGAVYFPLGERPIDTTGAFAAVAVTTLAGIAIALRCADPTPAVVALIGAYLSPFVLNTGSDQSLNFLIYLSLVTALGWALDFIRWRWIGVRITACLGAWISYSIWQTPIGSHHRPLALIFAWAFYCAFAVDFFFSAQQLSRRPAEKLSASLHKIIAVFSLINTAFAFNAFYEILNHPSLPEVGAAAVLMAILQLVAALMLEPTPLKLSSYLQAAALITMAIPLLLDHFAITVAWAVMSLLVCVLGRIFNLKWLYRWSAALWLFAVCRLLASDAFNENLWKSWFFLGSLSVCAGLLMAWGLSVLAHIIANLSPPSIRIDKSSNSAAAAQILAALGTLLFISSKLIHPHPAEWTFTALVWTALFLALRPVLQLDYTWHILALLMGITAKWLIVDSIIPISSHWNTPASPAVIPFINHSAIAGCALIGLLFWSAPRVRSRSDVAGPAIYIWIGSVVFAFLSIEGCRCVDYLAGWPDAVIKQVVLSILWASIGLGAIFVGFSRRMVALRYAALVLLGITLLKILLVDMADVQAIWRILSFLAVGLLLLAVSYIYHNQFNRPAVDAAS